MLYWIREIAGWCLVLVALYIMRTALVFLMDLDSPRIVEAAVLSFTALGVLRAGVMLIRISTAARVCRIDRV